jgi:hypothetical protein
MAMGVQKQGVPATPAPPHAGSLGEATPLAGATGAGAQKPEAL